MQGHAPNFYLNNSFFGHSRRLQQVYSKGWGFFPLTTHCLYSSKHQSANNWVAGERKRCLKQSWATLLANQPGISPMGLENPAAKPGSVHTSIFWIDFEGGGLFCHKEGFEIDLFVASLSRLFWLLAGAFAKQKYRISWLKMNLQKSRRYCGRCISKETRENFSS